MRFLLRPRVQNRPSCPKGCEADSLKHLKRVISIARDVALTIVCWELYGFLQRIQVR